MFKQEEIKGKTIITSMGTILKDCRRTTKTGKRVQGFYAGRDGRPLPAGVTETRRIGMPCTIHLNSIEKVF